MRQRIRSVQGIEKITGSMKMVAAARLGKQERTTLAARPFSQTLQAHFLDAENKVDTEGKKQLVLLVTSDKGLCGALNSQLTRPLQRELRANPDMMSVACIGVKGRNGLASSFKASIMLHVSEFGKNPVTFMEAAYVTDTIFNGPEEERREHQVHKEIILSSLSLSLSYVLFSFFFP